MKKLLLGLLVPVFFMSMWAESPLIEYRRALESDIPSLLSLMEESSSEADKLTVLPKACRESYLSELINKKHLFVAVVGNEVAATKKLFIAQGEEKKDLFRSFIRSEGENARLSFRGKVEEGGVVVPFKMSLSQPAYGVCIYDGFDYTKKAYRGRGLQNELFKFAFKAIASQVQEALRRSSEKNITLLYGLTYANAGERPGIFPDRTPSMARAFQSFIKQFIDKGSSKILLEISRFHTFMPTYDLDGTDCHRLLPDDKSDPVYSYILTYELKNALV